MKNTIQPINKFQSVCNSLARVARPRQLFPLHLLIGLLPVVLAATAQADCRQGCDSSANTFLGEQVLISTGFENTGVGWYALSQFTSGGWNTAEGSHALYNNRAGYANTADGSYALQNNASSSYNTAVGTWALQWIDFDNPGYNTAVGIFALQGSDYYYPNYGSYNTAIGASALPINHDGNFNTAIGYLALQYNYDGSYNTATGVSALNGGSGIYNTADGYQAGFAAGGGYNTAIGVNALYYNTSSYNTATGATALYFNISGVDNTANGFEALYSNTTGDDNTASGNAALLSNTTGNNNAATGNAALYLNTTGSNNTAYGLQALYSNTIGINNTADGLNALFSNTTGSSNIALGTSAGFNLTTGKNNIDIGNAGLAGESAKIRIGTNGTQKATFIAGISGVAVPGGVGVIVGTDGKLGTVVSSERFKDAIKPMDKASEAILSLQPVTFRYKHDLDPDGMAQFGLVAEQVEKVNPDLVARDEHGKPYTVRYDAVNAMLLNEFLKEHRKVEEQQAMVTQLRAMVAKQEISNAQQQTKMEGLTAALKEQAAQIQKVSDQLRTQAISPRVVANN
jgi:hypothetical protein